MKGIRYIVLLIVFFFTGLLLPAGAQNNPYKIDDSLYPLYQRATKYRTYPQGLLIADTLYTEALKKGDKKAECLAFTIPVVFYFNRNDEENLEKAVEDLKVVSRENNFLQYYYFACIYKINNLLNTGKTLRALQEAEMTKEQAFKDNHAYGIVTCMKMTGNIYYIRMDKEEALKYYQNALKYTQENLKDQDEASLYWNISLCYRGMKQYRKAYENAEKGIKCAKTEINRLACLLEKCQVLYGEKRNAEFETCYEECIRMADRYGEAKREAFTKIRIYHNILGEKYEEAYALCNSIVNIQERTNMLHHVFLAEGKYKEAYEAWKWVNNYRDSVNRQIQSNDIAEFNARLGNEQLKRKAQALQLENTQLNLKNTTLELDKVKSQIELEKINAQNNKLQLDNRNLELARVKAEAERQQNLMREQQLKSRHQVLMLRLELCMLLLFIGGLTLYLYTRRKAIKALREKNNELVIARDCAEQADKMKTFFIQNMSHEIRTPLNAIVGFSQVLTDPDMEFDLEEKRDFSMRIQQSSELLTTLVNDILDLSNLESGRYTLNLDKWCCNELCRIALSNVSHRKPDKVKLYFTSEVSDDFLLNTDGKRLQQVLINFLTNAEKNTETGEIHLHCSLAEYPGKVTFSVTDTGTGIPADKIDSIFERFRKLDEFKQGSGLGLNICRMIAERLEGEVMVDKSYTNGARFLFVLPLV